MSALAPLLVPVLAGAVAFVLFRWNSEVIRRYAWWSGWVAGRLDALVVYMRTDEGETNDELPEWVRLMTAHDVDLGKRLSSQGRWSAPPKPYPPPPIPGAPPPEDLLR